MQRVREASPANSSKNVAVPHTLSTSFISGFLGTEKVSAEGYV
jgi:hypothetical protein